MRVHFVAIALTVLSAAYGQNSASFRSGPEGFSGTAHFGGVPMFGMSAITGAPYCGEEVSESVQTLADGTRITRPPMPARKICRDSAGRTRVERQMFVSPRGGESLTIIEITDPVERVWYVLDTINKVAHRQELPPSPTGPPVAAGRAMGATISGPLTTPGGGRVTAGAIVAAPPPGGFDPPKMTNEKLEPQTIEGIPVEGTRRTTTMPVGAVGNDRPITTVTETWMSPDLRVMILSRTNDPRNGEHTQKLINISRSEPDPSLFQPPPEYTVVNETGEFTLRWGSARP